MIRAMNQNEPGSGRVVVSDQPVADFSHLTAPEQLAAISRVEGGELDVLANYTAFQQIRTMLGRAV